MLLKFVVIEGVRLQQAPKVNSFQPTNIVIIIKYHSDKIRHKAKILEANLQLNLKKSRYGV